MDFSSDIKNLVDGHPRVNLEHWLMGCPREIMNINLDEKRRVVEIDGKHFELNGHPDPKGEKGPLGESPDE